MRRVGPAWWHRALTPSDLRAVGTSQVTATSRKIPCFTWGVLLKHSRGWARSAPITCLIPYISRRVGERIVLALEGEGYPVP